MRIGPRLWLTGAVLPMALLAVTLVITVQLFRVRLEEQLDRGLSAQAAVEAVSLFDAPDGKVHLHMERSPLLAEVQRFAPTVVVYGPDGTRAVRFPENAPGPQRLDERAPDEPRLTTVVSEGERHRVLLVEVRSPDNEPYALRLEASLAQIDSAVRLLQRVGGAVVAAFTLLLFALQGAQARRMSRRLGALESHMARVGRGDLSAAPLPDDGKDEIANLRDAIAEATTELAETRRARERLVADAAHEIKTPLTNMRTAIDVALRRERDAASLRASLEDTREEVIRLAHLSSHLLELSSLTSVPMRKVPLHLDALLREATAGFQAAAESRGVELVVDARLREPCPADPARLRQAVDNLLSNALKFAPAGSQIRLTARADLEGERVRVEVRDEGPGVPEEERQSIFAPFHRAKAAPPGAGLGLAIVQEVAERHGGRIFVEDARPGARFVLELPLGAG